MSTEKGIRERVASALEAVGFRVDRVGSLKQARDRLAVLAHSIVVIDLDAGVAKSLVPEVSDVVRLAREDRSAPVLLLTDHARFRTAAELVASGARDFLMKPFSPEELLRRVGVAMMAAGDGEADNRKAPGKTGPADENQQPGHGIDPTELPPVPRDDLILGSSPQIERVIEQVRLVARKDTTVLLTGETGTGKERAAQAIHELSLRSRRPRVSVNCGGIPATLLEDEFFGHVKGAFTDAYQTRVGRFEQADGGTIFLDEIGDLPLELQPKLLRVLQEREIHRVGGVESIQVDVRIVAATNVDLWSRVREGRFREDLFYRINVFPIHLPPLRERREDIPLFIRRFLEQLCYRHGVGLKKLDPAAEADLIARPWPGNIRELENAVEIAVIRSRNRALVQTSDFPEPRPVPSLLEAAPSPEGEFQQGLKGLVSKFEYDLIARTLEKTGGNKSQAAELLGVKRTTLVEKLKKHRQADPQQT